MWYNTGILRWLLSDCYALKKVNWMPKCTLEYPFVASPAKVDVDGLIG